MSKAYKDLKEKRGRPSETVYLHVRHDLDRQLQDLERELVVAEHRDRQNKGMVSHEPEAPKVAEKIRQLEEEAKNDAVPVTFVEIGRKRWRDLEEQHPPTDEQQRLLDESVEEGKPKQKLKWNADTFPPAAMAASCVEPEGLTDQDFVDMAEDFGEGEYERLWQACMLANFRGRELPFSQRAFAALQSYQPKVGSPSERE